MWRNVPYMYLSYLSWIVEWVHDYIMYLERVNKTSQINSVTNDEYGYVSGECPR